MLIALSMCPLILGIAFAICGVDLWRLRKRGRAPAPFLLIMFGIIGANLALINSVEHSDTSATQLWIGSVVAVLCVWGIVYLCLPRVSRLFIEPGF